jgi:hypothetical protein
MSSSSPSPFHHQLTPIESFSVSSDWLSRELSRAQSSLEQVQTALAQRRGRHYSQDDHQGDNADDSSHHDRNDDAFSSPRDRILKLQSLSNQIDCLSIAAGYIDALKKSSNDSSSSSDPIAPYSLQHLVNLESELGILLQSYNGSEDHIGAADADADASSCSSREFQYIQEEIRKRQNHIQRHIRARAVLTLRKVFQKFAYPSSNAMEYILSQMNHTTKSDQHDNDDESSDVHASFQTLKRIDVQLLAKELARPLVQRVQHHFLKSETIPKDKILKVPHLLFAYLRQVLPYMAPIVMELECEVYFYRMVHDVIQHVMFQRGFYEKISGANIVTLTNLIQDILKYDDYTSKLVRRECWADMPTLVDRLICHNSKLLDGWIRMERTFAISALDRTACKKDGCDAIVSTAEVFYSLVHSHRCKMSFFKQVPKCKIQFFQQVILGSCMHYLNLLHRRATALRSAMDKSTIYDLSVNSAQWIILIQCTEQAAETLQEQDDGIDENERSGNKNIQQQLFSLSESFQKFSVAMVEECAQRLVDLLMERSTFSSFLMTAGHLLSHGSGGGVSFDGMEDVCMILSVWSDDAADDSEERLAIKDGILEKVCRFIQEQLLEIVFDESLFMVADGCKKFSEVVCGLLRVLNGRRQRDCGKLDNVCAFMSQVENFREPLYVLLGKESHQELDYLELEEDGTLYSEIENMLQGKGFSCMNVEDAISLVNRIRK